MFVMFSTSKGVHEYLWALNPGGAERLLLVRP